MAQSPMVASRMAAALAHRTWSVASDEGGPRCHLFLLLAGRAVLARPHQPDAEVAAPAMLWLPHPARGTLQVMAGGHGFTASVGAEFVQRTVADAALAGYLRPLLDQAAFAGPGALAPHLASLAASFEALVEELHGSRLGAAAVMGLHLGLLLVHFWRCAGPRRLAGSRKPGATTVRRFRQLVELHYREGLRIDAYAGRLGVTRAHLHDACLRATGRTPLALLHGRVLEEARLRLEQTDLSVEQVGYGLGFRDPGYFNRFFKRLAGQSPGAFRKGAAGPRAPADAASFAAWP